MTNDSGSTHWVGSLPEFTRYEREVIHPTHGGPVETHGQILRLLEKVGTFLTVYRHWGGMGDRAASIDELGAALADLFIATQVTADVLCIDLTTWRPFRPWGARPEATMHEALRVSRKANAVAARYAARSRNGQLWGASSYVSGGRVFRWRMRQALLRLAEAVWWFAHVSCVDLDSAWRARATETLTAEDADGISQP
jgi:hypothetical protein